MKGTLRRPPDPLRSHLINDYRDPVPRVLPPVPEYELREKPDLDSVLNVRSNDELWDRLRGLKVLRRNRFTSFADLKNRQRAILLSLPYLSPKELRRQKLPAYEVIPLELEEEGFVFASELLRYLIDRHDIVLKDSGQFEKASLRQDPRKIALLARLLKEMNIYINKGLLRHLITLSLNSAVFFERKRKDWWWLAAEFYKISTEVSHLIKSDFGYCQAIINYSYGKFLLFKLEDRSKALECLLKAWDMSKGKVWNIEWLSGIQDETIAECSRQLSYITYLAEAEAQCYDDPDTAMRRAQEAFQVALEGTEMNEAMFDYATYALQADKPTEALNILNTLSEKCIKGINLDMYLSVQFLIVECLMRQRDPVEAITKLKAIVRFGVKIRVPWLRALAFRYIAQICLHKGDKKTAMKYFTNAIKINKQENNLSELAKCEYLIGCYQNNESNDTEL